MRKPKYEMIADEIISKIITNEYLIGTLIPSEMQLQKKYNVSRQTVRQALSLLANRGYIRKEQGLGSFVDDQYLNTNPTNNKIIAIITTYFSEYIFPSIIRGVEETLRQKGYSLLIASTNNNMKQEEECLKMMLNQNVQGIIIEPTKSNKYNPNLGYYLAIKKQNIPIVMINAYYEEMNFPYLVLDDVKAGFLATNHLISYGHQNMALICKTDDMQGKKRMKGFIKAHDQNSLSFDSNYVFTYETETAVDVVKLAAKKVAESQGKITAVVCYNDDIANRFVHDLAYYGLHVPEDCSVTGIDDSHISTSNSLKLTTVKHPQKQMGKDAANFILSEIESRKTLDSIVYEPELVIRNSTKKIM